jgi:hypothetical protein
MDTRPLHDLVGAEGGGEVTAEVDLLSPSLYQCNCRCHQKKIVSLNAVTDRGNTEKF